MIEQNALAGINPVDLVVVHSDSVSIELGHPLGTAGIEGSGFLLGDILDLAVELGGGGLVNAVLWMRPRMLTASRMRSVPKVSKLAVYSGPSKLTATWLWASRL